jgi:SAM-dependent methyltransferase
VKLLYDKKFAFHYDDITLSGYYDYSKEVKVIKSIVGKRKALLELGSGTGSLLIPLAKSGFNVAGIDNSPAMIKILKQKQRKEGLVFPNLKADQRKLSLGRRFEVIVTSGGFMWFVTLKNKLYLSIYGSLYRDIEKTFKNAFNHLKKGGLFLVNIQHHGQTFNLKLKNGNDYHFEIEFKTASKIIKTHYIEKNGKLIFKRAFPQRLFPEEVVKKTAEKFGFKALAADKTYSFYIFERL